MRTSQHRDGVFGARRRLRQALSRPNPAFPSLALRIPFNLERLQVFDWLSHRQPKPSATPSRISFKFAVSRKNFISPSAYPIAQSQDAFRFGSERFSRSWSRLPGRPVSNSSGTGDGNPFWGAGSSPLNRAFQFINKLLCLAANVVGQTRVDDALDASRLNASGRFGFKIEDCLSRAQNCTRFRILDQ